MLCICGSLSENGHVQNLNQHTRMSQLIFIYWLLTKSLITVYMEKLCGANFYFFITSVIQTRPHQLAYIYVSM